MHREPAALMDESPLRDRENFVLPWLALANVSPQTAFVPDFCILCHFTQRSHNYANINAIDPQPPLHLRRLINFFCRLNKTGNNNKAMTIKSWKIVSL
ncbi:hypothetical protein AVEN_65941-1 [Araneus ventricosus]|uniref:Uncharacterized protein n=1 Tax=Araneus ventricosus TaxID=182803 RepID=A0A4Y2F2M6_ARAVE|nr:hypothetical protein AVEN_65941-1 [Araneus ventricosus]